MLKKCRKSMEKVWSKRFGKFGRHFFGIFFENYFEKLGEEIRWKNCGEYLVDKLGEKKKLMEKLVQKLGEKLC